MPDVLAVMVCAPALPFAVAVTVATPDELVATDWVSLPLPKATDGLLTLASAKNETVAPGIGLLLVSSSVT